MLMCRELALLMWIVRRRSEIRNALWLVKRLRHLHAAESAMPLRAKFFRGRHPRSLLIDIGGCKRRNRGVSLVKVVFLILAIMAGEVCA
jgi:hypothetical protein